MYRSADKSLAQPARKQTAPLKIPVDSCMDWLG